MDIELIELISSLHSESTGIRDEAVLRVCLLLEKHTLLANDSDFYRGLLPEHLVSKSLTDEDQMEMLKALGNVILNGKSSFNVILFGLKDSSKQYIISIGRILLETHLSTRNEDVIGDILMVISRCLSPSNRKQNISLLSSEDGKLVKLIQEISLNSNAHLKELSEGILNKI